MKKFSEKEWLEDFQSFAQSEGIKVPRELTEKISREVYADLNPPAWMVFGKIVLIQASVGTLSLAICSQFDLNPFGTGFTLSDYFMKFGHSACMVFCGVLFLALGIGTARLFLSFEEAAVLRKNAPLQILGLSGISLGLFAVAGAELLLSLALLWLLGAMLGGLVAAYISGGRKWKSMSA